MTGSSPFPPSLLNALFHHPALVDALYSQYQADPNSVSTDWRVLFEGKQTLPPNVAAIVSSAADAHATRMAPGSESLLAESYRQFGHFCAQTNPLEEPTPIDRIPELNAESDPAMDSLKQFLQARYCGPIGYEFTHAATEEERHFWVECVEKEAAETLSKQQRTALWKRLLTAETLEKFIHTKFVGAKRFSLEGGESLLPALDAVLAEAHTHGCTEAVLGMAHRGRLNVLVNLLGKPARDLFSEFDDVEPESVIGKGDVKYHMGYTAPPREEQPMGLTLAFNPSHLEAVNPVVLGQVRHKQHRSKGILGILIHGDAAFVGQGVVAESLNLSQVEGYQTGGTVHIVINNQVGFTTSPAYSRSSHYCTDVAKMVQAPILHVNGDDPEAVVRATQLACRYQQRFRKDVVLDIVCYRRYGHNESDEPTFTQPQLYQRIASHPSVATLYGQRLVSQGTLLADDLVTEANVLHQKLEAELAQARAAKKRPVPQTTDVWRPFVEYNGSVLYGPDTHISANALPSLVTALTDAPPHFSLHPKVSRLLQQRKAMLQGQAPLDWATAELLAFGSLLQEGRHVRFTGQDSRRGTFSQRHAAWVDQQTGASHIGLQHLSTQKPGVFSLYDSTLSEAAVVGFEYGYSLEDPHTLVLWEAQFGDFVNGAQTMLDQFLSAGEQKWRQLSSLVLLLPHGYEGQGPEHSSARYERFLQLCAQNNMQVVYPTTPAQHFHVLRRQIHAPWRKPLVVITPKSLLRHPAVVSPLSDFTDPGRFQAVVADKPEASVSRVLLCTGKVYYDLVEEKARRGDEHTALVRIEQLYPLDTDGLQSLLRSYTQAKNIVWVQEEPANMGALFYMRPILQSMLTKAKGLHFVSRPMAASPATGSHKAHAFEQQRLVQQAFDVNYSGGLKI